MNMMTTIRAHVSASGQRSINPAWPALVADYRTKYAAWLDVCDFEDRAMDEVKEACASLPEEPQRPNADVPIIDLTIRQIKALSEGPEHKAAWAEYERVHAEWSEQRDQLCAKVMAPAKAAHDQAYSVYAEALNTLTTHRVATLTDLGEKIGIMAKEYAWDALPIEYVADILADIQHIAGQEKAISPAPALTSTQSAEDWDAALSQYCVTRDRFDRLPLTAKDGDAAVDACCEAMDRLVKETPAPTPSALIQKIELGKARWDGFEHPDEWLDAYISDIRRLSANQMGG